MRLRAKKPLRQHIIACWIHWAAGLKRSLILHVRRCWAPLCLALSFPMGQRYPVRRISWIRYRLLLILAPWYVGWISTTRGLLQNGDTHPITSAGFWLLQIGCRAKR